jgi:hypothetical protein
MATKKQAQSSFFIVVPRVLRLENKKTLGVLVPPRASEHNNHPLLAVKLVLIVLLPSFIRLPPP